MAVEPISEDGFRLFATANDSKNPVSNGTIHEHFIPNDPPIISTTDVPVGACACFAKTAIHFEKIHVDS